MGDVEGLIRRFHQLQTSGEHDAVLAMYADDGARFAAGKETRGRDALRRFYERTRGGLRVEGRRLLRVGVAGPTSGFMEFQEDAAHVGPVPTPLGDIEGSGARFQIHGAAIFDFDGDRIARMATYSDGLFQMLARSRLLK
jgi:hypothetical protein